MIFELIEKNNALLVKLARLDALMKPNQLIKRILVL